jgi:hypothetical protein
MNVPRLCTDINADVGKIDSETYKDDRTASRTKQHEVPGTAVLPVWRILRRKAMDGL